MALDPRPCFDDSDCCEFITALELPLPTAVTTAIASSATDVALLAANADRRRLIIQNDSTAVLYVLLAASGASETFFSFSLSSNENYEMPYAYTGPLSGAWEEANGQALLTELEA